MGNQGNGAHRVKSRLSAILGICVIICAASNISGCAAATRVPATNFSVGNDQMANMIEVMNRAGDFGGWANVLYAMDPAVLPIKATFFVPSDDALSRVQTQAELTSSILLYHIIPHQLSYYSLQRFEMGMRLPTMLANQTILVTSNRQSNYTLDDVLVTLPDIFNDGTFAVHGIADLLNFTRYGADLPTSTPLGDAAAAPGAVEVLTPVPDGNSNTGSMLPRGSGWRSNGPCLCKEFVVTLTAASVVFVIYFLPFLLR